MAEVALPTITGYVDQNWFLEPLTGSPTQRNILNRFPPEVYNANPESHLARLLYVLIGPAGIGFLRQNALQARLALEELGLELFDLDAFYGAPLKFTRITQELYDEDPRGLLTREQWDAIRARDAQYRSRALDFLDGVRAGNSPTGMRYVARSGLGHEVSIIENYKALFDEWADEPLGITNYGRTRFAEEMVVMPRREIARSEVQKIEISGAPTGGTFTIEFTGNTTSAIAWNASAGNVQSFLEALQAISPGDVEVTGGPLPNQPIYIRFMGTWSARNVPQIRTTNSLSGGTTPQIQSSTEQGGVDAADEVAYISPQDMYHLQVAIDRIRPQNTIPTYYQGEGLRSRTLFQAVTGSSDYDEVVRFVTGNANVTYPGRDSVSWVEANVEHQAPRALGDDQYQYSAFHNVSTVRAFTEDAIEDPDFADSPEDTMDSYPSNHVGSFSEFQVAVIPYLGAVTNLNMVPDMALSDTAEPLAVRNIVEDAPGGTSIAQLINGMYPVSYATLPGVPVVKYDYEQFWASVERKEGDEYLEIDLGTPRVVNSVQFEIIKKPIDVTIEYDLLDMPSQRRYVPARLIRGSSTSINFAPEDQNPWQFTEYTIGALDNRMIYTRYIRIKFSRRNNVYSPFAILDLAGSVTDFYPWSVDVRNLRVGRNVTNVQ